MAVVLACGPGAALSHASAGALWGVGAGGSKAIEVSVPTSAERRCKGAIVHRRPALAASDLTRREEIPLTSLTLTLVDLAGRLGRAEVERAVNQADRLDLITPESLRKSLEAYAGRSGVASLRAVLDSRTFRLTDSELERQFIGLARRAGLPMPETRRLVNGFRVDFLWPDLNLVVETDGLRYHRTPAQQTRDRVRDQAHLAAGLTPLRFTHAQVRFEADHVCATLRAVARRLAP